MKRIHIIGAPRSGTSLMLEAMANCTTIDAYSQDEMWIYSEPPRKHRIFCSKWPLDTNNVSYLLRLQSHLWIICMIRDPRDVVVSKHDGFKGYAYDLGGWKKSVREALRLKHHRRFVTVRYEDLARRPDEVQADVLRAIPFLKKKAPFSSYHLSAKPSRSLLDAMHGLRPISSEGIGAWRNHKPRLLAQLIEEGSISKELIELGYEENETWLQELNGVKAQQSESYIQDEPLSFRRKVHWVIKRFLLQTRLLVRQMLLFPVFPYSPVFEKGIMFKLFRQ